MPIYTVEGPGGVTFDLEGDSPPTDQELEQIFASYKPASISPLSPEERLQRQEHLASIASGQAPIGATETLAQGILNSLLAGTPEAIATRSGVPLSEIEAIKQANPYTYAIGETLGAAFPLGTLGKVATGLKQLALTGARQGGIYGAGQGISQAAIQDQPELAQALETALKQGAIGATLGAGIPVGVVGASNLASRLSPALRSSAEKNVAQTLLAGGGTKENKAIVERLTPEILNRPFTETFAMTRKGLETKSEVQRELAGEAIDAFGKLTGNVNPNQVSVALEKLKAPYTVEGKIIDQTAIDRIQSLQDTFDQFGDSISTEGLRTIRRTFDTQIREAKGFFQDLDQGSVTNLKKVASDEIRGILAQKEPDLAKLNKQYSFWANLNDVMGATNLRKKGQSSGLVSNLAGIAGAATATGGPVSMATQGIVFKVLTQTIQSPAWKLASARVKNNLAEALADNDPSKILSVLSQVPGFNAADFQRELDESQNVQESNLPETPKTLQQRLSEIAEQ